MNGLRAALWIEALKLRRSRIWWLTLLGGSIAPIVGGLFMVILKDPAWARQNGLITTKAQIVAGTADWPTLWGMLSQAVAIGGMVLFGLVAIWSFGREWSDRTVKDLLAVPTSRSAIVVAKFIVAVLWMFVLALVIYLEGLGVGTLVGLPGWTPTLALAAAGKIALLAALTAALVTPLAWVACAGRGYLPPVGVLFLLIVLAQVVAATGWGGFFPWSVAALASGAAGPEMAQVGGMAYVVVLLTGVAGIAATLGWWHWADQH